jgi:hypothetical protein
MDLALRDILHTLNRQVAINLDARQSILPTWGSVDPDQSRVDAL